MFVRINHNEATWLRGLAYRVSVEEDRLIGERGAGDAKLKKAQRNG